MVFKHFKGETLLIPKFIMTIGGIWPSGKREIGALIVLGIWLALKVVQVIIRLINPSGSIHVGSTTLAGLVWTLCTISMELSVRMNSDRILRLIESKSDNRWSVRNLKDRQILKNHQIHGALFFVVSVFFLFVVSSVARIIMFFPFRNGAEWSVNKQRALKDYDNWLIVSGVLKNVIIFHDGLMMYGTLMLFWSLNMHLSMEFKILKMRFQKCLRIKCKERSHQVFRRLVDRHNQLLEWTDELKNSFFVFLTIEVYAVQLHICDAAHQLAIGINNGSFVALITMSFDIAMCLWLLFIVYNSGELLTTCSEEIADVLYQCKWYNLSKGSRNNFAMVILRCRMPVTLKVGGCLKLNHSNYKHLVDAVYSYISLILAITKPD